MFLEDELGYELSDSLNIEQLHDVELICMLLCGGLMPLETLQALLETAGSSTATAAALTQE